MIRIYDNAQVSADVQVGDFSVIGKASRPRFIPLREEVSNVSNYLLKTTIAKGCYIGCQVLIEEGVTIGENCVIEGQSKIEKGSEIAANTFVVHGAHILQDSKIMSHCVIGGFIADRSRIGENSRVFGALLHKQSDPYIPWDKNIEPSPVLADHVFVGVGALVIGNVQIAHNVYICSGAIVTRDVPPFSVVTGINDITPVTSWKGNLRESSFLKKST